MSENPLILTWFVPPAPEALLRLFNDAPATTWTSGDLLLRETEPYDALYRIDEGVVGQAVINHALAKPVAMNLYVKDTVPGFLNLFSGLPSPRRLIVQQPGAVVRKIPKADALERIRKDPELLYLTARWCEAASKSELIGMEALFSLPAEERLALFFTSAALACGRLDAARGVYELPVLLTRASLCDVVYVTTVTIDRLLALWRRRGLVTRSPSGGWAVDAELVDRTSRWLREH